MRRAARVDANHADISRALLAIGASVADTSRVGGGFPDLVVGFRGRNWLIEVKDGSKRPSARKLTPDQQRFVAGWRGHWVCVESADEAIEVVSRAPGCRGGDPLCPCQDGLLCHYVDPPDGRTKALPIP